MSDDKGFEIRDRRTVSGSDAGTGAKGEDTKEESKGEAAGGMPQFEFISFVGSLGGTALMYMGERLAPEQPETPRDLPAAKHMIDLIDMLKAKTKGNLTEDEAGMLDTMLYNLRMRYIQELGRK